MTTQTRPRQEEFFLALLWILGTAAWGYFGIAGYAENLSNYSNNAAFNITGFILSFFLLCLTVFGLRFSLNTFLRIWRRPPVWLDTLTAYVLGITLLSGGLFSLFTLTLVAIKLFTDSKVTNLIFAWGLAASVAIGGLAVFQFLAALHTFEPFMDLVDSEGQPKKIAGWALPVKSLQRRLHGRHFGPYRSRDEIRGPLLLEADTRTTLHDAKLDGRPGLEKTLAAHGGYHISMLGFTANGATIFAVSDGGMVHYQAGGRKGIMFPPELKFWEWASGRIQTATLGSTQTFLTSNYKSPPSLHNYKFLVPTSGEKFGWATPNSIVVGEWQSEKVQTLNIEEPLVMRGWNGFVPLAFNPEGSRIAWCGENGQTRYWNLETEQVQPLRAYPTETDDEHTGTENGAWGLVFSPDGTRIATIGGKGLLLQNVYTGWKWFRPTELHQEQMTAFAFSNTGYEMAVGMWIKPHLIQLAQNSRRNSRYSQQNGYNFSDEAGTVATETKNEEFVPILRLWDLREDRYVDMLLGNYKLNELIYSPDNRLLAGVDEAGILRLWEISLEGSVIRPPRQLLELDLGITGRKVIVTFSPDVERLLCATDNRILMWNLAKLRQEAQTQAKKL